MAKAKKTKKTKANPKQGKIPGTGRIDAIPEIEAQAEVYRTKCAERMELQLEETAEQQKLTDLLKKHGLTEYKYEDEEGVLRRAYMPDDDGPRAKVQKVKKKKNESDAA